MRKTTTDATSFATCLLKPRHSHKVPTMKSICALIIAQILLSNAAEAQLIKGQQSRTTPRHLKKDDKTKAKETYAPTDGPTYAPTYAPTYMPTGTPTKPKSVSEVRVRCRIRFENRRDLQGSDPVPTYMPTYMPTYKPTYMPTEAPAAASGIVNNDLPTHVSYSSFAIWFELSPEALQLPQYSLPVPKLFLSATVADLCSHGRLRLPPVLRRGRPVPFRERHERELDPRSRGGLHRRRRDALVMGGRSLPRLYLCFGVSGRGFQCPSSGPPRKLSIVCV